MITGFNTDIEHDGIVYHVQTEDKGLDTPIILSLVYSGGAILASKRAPYEDLIAEGFSDEALAERLKRQHKLICAAIHSGRINDLKRMSSKPADVQVVEVSDDSSKVQGLTASISVEELPVTVEPQQIELAPAESSWTEVSQVEVAPVETRISELVSPETPKSEEAPAEASTKEFELAKEPGVDVFEIADIPSQVWSPPEKVETEPPPAAPEPESNREPEVIAPKAPAHDKAYTVYDSRGQAQTHVEVEEGLNIILLDDSEFYSGTERTLRVLVVNRNGDDERPLGGVAISIKILGTTFRPLIYSLKSDRDGVATITSQIPQFSSGRAAVLIRAVTKQQAAELRRIIHPGK